MASTNIPRPQHYNMLGIRPDATSVDVKKGYHRMARLRHPDKHGNSAAATEEFQKLQQAYETLSNPKTRYTYDQAIASELARSVQARGRCAELLGRAQRDAARTQPAVDYKKRLLEALGLRLKQKQRAYDAAERRILDTQAFVIISDDDEPEPAQPPRSDTKHDSLGQNDTEAIGEMPPQIVSDLTLAKQDHQEAAADLQDAELYLKRAKDEAVVLQGQLRKLERDCAELEREYNPHWQHSEAARTRGQPSFDGGAQAMFRGHPSHAQYEASRHPQNPSRMPTPMQNGHSPSFSFAGPPPGQEKHHQRARSFSAHDGIPSRHQYPPPSQQPPWPHHVRPVATSHPPEAMGAEIKMLKARVMENDKVMESLVQRNLALEDEVQRLRQMMGHANKPQAGGDSTTEKKRGRPGWDDDNVDKTGGKGAKAAKRA
ncbi:hypothetical protein QBC41DRAFT_245860 [Cercophora samala]|uniref:J domain-containing protein n=1 Tax=Cercophora samala TaxID=330535 RepID=A0AA39ZHS7_9PEZI|nr:hypothetical protein QBC41DRAFT_245860 [Cercophora samala]